MLLGNGTTGGLTETPVPDIAPTNMPADTPPLFSPDPSGTSSAAMLPGRSAPVGAWPKTR